ncbi:protein kinase, partial [Acidobacteria bacterium AH-259-O06]|nr:protein kinase [Acidobacteria bacterium AH-259-O06]
VDKRADIWAFGSALYELLTGKRPFEGETVTETLAGILKGEPDWEVLPENTPWNIRTLLRRCLQKDPHERLQHIGDARIEMKQALSEPSLDTELALPKAAPSYRQQVLPWALLSGVMTVAAVIIAALHFGQSPEGLHTIRFLISPPEKISFRSYDLPVVSADGQQIVFSGLDESGNAYLWVRKMDALTAQKLSGTEGAALPFWSPDSRFIGFFADRKLKKIDASGGPSLTLAEAPFGLGGTWSRDGTIVFAPTAAGPLHRVSAAGGEATPVTTLDQSRQEISHQWPYFLPDGRHFLYLARSQQQEQSGIYIGSLDSKESKFLLRADSNVAYAPPGYLLFGREQTLMAQPFDVKNLQVTAEPFPIVEQVGRYTSASVMTFSVSENGVLVYHSGGTANSRLVWLDRAGKQLGLVGEPGPYGQIVLSPDEKRVAVGRAGDTWLLELSSGIFSRFTFSGAGDPIWSPDGRQIAFGSNRKGVTDLFQKTMGGGGEEVLFESEDNKWIEDWSPDGRFIVYILTGGRAVYALPLLEDQKPKLLLETPFDKDEFHLSPDGQWVAYNSNESGRWEVYVASFPEFTEKRQVSKAGGCQALWRADGKELFYLGLDGKMAAVEVKSGSTLETGIPKVLFQTGVRVDPIRDQYCVTGDGQRFLVKEPVEETAQPIHVVLNWF